MRAYLSNPPLLYDLPIYAGTILAGGESERMGMPKALLNVAGQSLLQHHLNGLTELNLPLPTMVCDNQHKFIEYELISPQTTTSKEKCEPDSSKPVRVADMIAGAGPLSGMAGAMMQVSKMMGVDIYARHANIPSACPSQRQGWLLVLSVDALFTADMLLTQLRQYQNSSKTKLSNPNLTRPEAIVIKDSKQKLYPLLGAYQLSLLPKLQDYLEQGGRRVMQFIASLHTHQVQVKQQYQPYLNINTPEDYQRLLAARPWDL